MSSPPQIFPKSTSSRLQKKKDSSYLYHHIHKSKIHHVKKPLIIFILAVLAIAFFKFGRTIYMPVVHKIAGKETIETITTKIQNDVHLRLQKYLDQAGLGDSFPDNILLLAFKEERTLQVYTQQGDSNILIKEYPFTGFSGSLGPKLKEGDKQIPEGIYEVEYLNPNSAFYLSIKVSYPNAFDVEKSTLPNRSDMGGDIFIHGKSSTIGCIPIGDEAIEEVFLFTTKALDNGVKIIISPRDFRVNSAYPTIEAIDWEDELYTLISEELNSL